MNPTEKFWQAPQELNRPLVTALTELAEVTASAEPVALTECADPGRGSTLRDVARVHEPHPKLA